MRCNLVDPRILTDQHLMAERRELRMIPPLLEKQVSILRKNIRSELRRKIPSQFTLGKGHMLFWLDKFKFLEGRFNALTKEMKFRGFSPDPNLILAVDKAKHYGLYSSWLPSQTDILLSKTRIVERILQKPTWYRFHSLPISPSWVEMTYFPGQVVTDL